MITSLQPLDWLIIAAVFLFAVLIIFKTRIKSKREVDHILMGRQLTLPLFVITLVASWYGGLLGVTQVSFQKGVYNFITQGVFWYLSAIFFALFIAEKANKSMAMTLPELIGSKCGKRSRKLTAVFFFVKTLPIPYAISIAILFNIFFNVNLNLGVAIACIAIAIYSFYGGLKAVVVFDVFQFVCMFFSIVCVVVVSYLTYGGADYLQAHLPLSHLEVAPVEHLSRIFLWFIVAANTTLLSPIFYQRCFAAKSKKIAKRGIYLSVIFWFICDIFTTLCGLYAKANMPEGSEITAFITYALSILPTGLRGLFAICVFLTVISAMDAFFLAASNIVSHDILPPGVKNRKFFAATICAGFTMLIAPYFEGRLEDVWLTFESYFMAILLVPTLLAIFNQIKSDRRFVQMVLTNTICCATLTYYNYSYLELITYVSLLSILQQYTRIRIRFEKPLLEGV